MKQRTISFILPFLMLLLFNTPLAFAEQSTNSRLDILVGRAPKPAPAAPPAATDPPTEGTAAAAIAAVDTASEGEEAEPFPQPKPFPLRDQAFKDLLDKISPL